MASLDELIVPGAPILVTAGSENGARMMVMEAVWGRDVEPRELDVEFADPASLQSDWGFFHDGDVIVITSAQRSDTNVQEKLAEMMHDKNKSVVVVGSQEPSHMPPSKFSHWAKF